MATKKKILFRLALLGGAGYLIYRNRDKIIGKYHKLTRMGSVDEVVDDIGKTASNVFDGMIDSVEDMYEYVVTFGGGENIDSGINENFQKEMEEVVKGMPVNYGSQLRTLGHNLAFDINEWGNKDNTYSGVPVEPGKMPSSSFINWFNFLNMKGVGDFEKVLKIGDISLAYGSALDMKSDTPRNPNAKTMAEYISNPPVNYLEKNQVDWGNRPPFTDMTPRNLFIALQKKVSKAGHGRTIVMGKQTMVNLPSASARNIYRR